jgi:serine/threonine-protein kinase RsbW
MGVSTSVRLVLSSEIKLVDLVHTASERMAALAGFDDDEALNVGLAVRETVINAMLHGNKGNPELKVEVVLSASPGELRAKVRDQGNGFQRKQVPDPTAGAGLMQNSGRGLLLIDAFVDRVLYRNPARGGLEVTLIKRLPGKTPAKRARASRGNGGTNE